MYKNLRTLIILSHSLFLSVYVCVCTEAINEGDNVAFFYSYRSGGTVCDTDALQFAYHLSSQGNLMPTQREITSEDLENLQYENNYIRQEIHNLEQELYRNEELQLASNAAMVNDFDMNTNEFGAQDGTTLNIILFNIFSFVVCMYIYM